MMNYIDIYCERIAPGLWAEPFNAVTNISFFIAAAAVYILARRTGALNGPTYLLIVLLLAIGSGSTLFHTFANNVTMLADVIPILLYQVSFIWLYASGCMRFQRGQAAGLLAAFIALSILAGYVPQWVLNGSMAYAPALIFLIGLGLWHKRHARQGRYTLLLAALLFTLSLTFRSIDMAVCDSLPLGTHFLWHLLNGCVLYLSAHAYIRFHREK